MPISHKIHLKTTREQQEYFLKAAGTHRFTWNWALRAYLDHKEKYGTFTNCMALKKEFNSLKYQLFPWLNDMHRDSHAQAFSHLHQALQNFFKGNAAFPKFKAKHYTQKTFYVANDKLSLRIRKNSYQIRLPVIGWIAMTERPRYKSAISGACVSQVGTEWFISLTFKDAPDSLFKEIPATYLKGSGRSKHEGLDINTNEHVCSDGTRYLIPKKILTSKKDKGVLVTRLERLQRKLAKKIMNSSCKTEYLRAVALWEGHPVPFVYADFHGKNISKLKATVKNLHAQIKRIRQDFTHKMTTDLVRKTEFLGVEDLSVKAMTRSAKGTVEKPGKKVKQKSGLNRSMLNVAPYEIRRQLAAATSQLNTALSWRSLTVGFPAVNCVLHLAVVIKTAR